MSDEQKQRILWVDDEPTVLMMVAMLLQGHNYEVETAESGQEALEMLEKDSNFDLIGTDIRMANMDGLEMAKTVRDKYSDIPIIVLSAHASEKAKAVAEQIGVYAYLHKPFKIDNLLIVIKEAIDSR
jgi:CheY-like chemotaxis protein